jgi:hypothetical protein
VLTERKLTIDVQRALLFNGSILLDHASPTISQKLLRTPAGPRAPVARVGAPGSRRDAGGAGRAAELRPGVPVRELAQAGHYPQIEDATAIGELIAEELDAG